MKQELLFSNTIELISTYSVLLPILFGVYKFHRNYSSYYYVFLSWLVCSGVTNLVCVALASNGINNMYVQHVYTMFEFTFLLILYWKVMLSRRIRKATIWCTVAFFIFKTTDLLFITSFHQVDTLAITIESIIAIVFSILYFGQLLNERTPNLTAVPLFWINSGIIIYFSSNFFIFLFSTYILEDAEQYYVYWSIHNTLVVIRDILFTIAMAMLDKPETDRTYGGDSLATHL